VRGAFEKLNGMLSIVSFILVPIFLIMCGSNSDVEQLNAEPDSSIFIPLVDTGLTFSTSYFEIQKRPGNHNYQLLNSTISGDSTILNFYNKEENCIDSYNLRSGNYVSRMQGIIPKEEFQTVKTTFPNEDTCYFVEESSWFIRLHRGGLDTIDYLNKKIRDQKLAVEQFRMGSSFELISDSLFFFPLHVDPYSKGLVRMYNYPMTAMYNINSGELKTLGLKYPELYDKCNYGLLRPITQVYPPEKIVYNPNARGEIWEYNLTSGSIQIHDLRSRYQLKEIEPLTFKSTPRTKDMLMKHADLSGEYTHLVWDPYRNVYYRFFKHFRPEKKENGFYTTYMDDVISVIVASENFEIIGEFMLPEPCSFIYFAYPTPDGLIINNGSLFGEENNQINVRKINFDYID